MDLAHRPELLEAMVEANFFYVFIGVETPSRESLKETKKFQNLRSDPLDCVRFIQRRGLWVTAGFIIGFDSDTLDIFDRQIEFIEQAAIPWAMTGFLQAPPTTALFERMQRERRLIEDSTATTNFHAPNFRTILPLPDLLSGLSRMLSHLYSPERFFERAIRSLDHWKPRSIQKSPPVSLRYRMQVVLRSVWFQGILGKYRSVYWRFLLVLMSRFLRRPQKIWWGFVLLLSGHHFIDYSQQAARDLRQKRAQTHATSAGSHEDILRSLDA
jgi:radical SAM superfamily enzyme YgiQ (UPF0313 family)